MVLALFTAACGGPKGLGTAPPGLPSSPPAPVESEPPAPPVSDPSVRCGPAVFGPDGAEVRAAVRAVRLRQGAATDHARLSEALNGLVSGDGVLVCPGTHTLERTVVLERVTDITVEGAEALVLAMENETAIRVMNARDVRLLGLRLERSHRGEPSNEGPALIELADSEGVRLDRLRLRAQGGVALEVRRTRGVALSDVAFLDSVVGIRTEDATLERSGVVAFDAVEVPVSPPSADLVRSTGTRADGETFDPLAPADTKGFTALRAALTPGPRRAFFPVVTVGEVPYLVLDHTFGIPGHDAQRGEPPEETAQPPRVAPKLAGEKQLPRARRGDVFLFNAAGRCRARVGPPMYLDTSGCERSYSLALPLEGCGAAVAPLAVVGGDVPDLRWHARVSQDHPVSRDALDPRSGDWLSSRLARSLMGDWAFLKRANAQGLVTWRVDAEVERATVVQLGVQFEGEDCRYWAEQHRAAWLGMPDGRGGTVTRGWALPEALLAARPLVGALTDGGRFVGLVGRDALEVELWGRDPQGGLESLWTGRFWSDNDECLPRPTPVDFEGPCGP